MTTTISTITGMARCFVVFLHMMIMMMTMMMSTADRFLLPQHFLLDKFVCHCCTFQHHTRWRPFLQLRLRLRLRLRYNRHATWTHPNATGARILVHVIVFALLLMLQQGRGHAGILGHRHVFRW